MAIRTALVPGVRPGMLREEHRVDGDSPWAAHASRESAEKREAELAASKQPKHS